MASRSTVPYVRFIFVVLLIILLSELCCDVEARGFRKSASRRASRRAPKKNVRRVQNKQRVTTRRKVTTFRSSVTKNQISSSSVPKSFQTRFIGGAIVLYALSRAPVYSHGYDPYHTSKFVIPRDRALRINKEVYRLEKSNGKNCTKNVKHLKLKGTEVVNVTTTISYEIDPKLLNGARNIATLLNQTESSIEKTNMTISDAVDYYIINMKTRTQYNKTVIDVADSNCTVVVLETKAYMVIMDSSSGTLFINCFAFYIPVISILLKL